MTLLFSLSQNNTQSCTSITYTLTLMYINHTHPTPRTPSHTTPSTLQVDNCKDPSFVSAVAAARPATVCCSGLTGQGVPELLQSISDALQAQMMAVEALVPYKCGELVDEIHRVGYVWVGGWGELGRWGRCTLHTCDYTHPYTPSPSHPFSHTPSLTPLSHTPFFTSPHPPSQYCQGGVIHRQWYTSDSICTRVPST